MSIEFTRDNCHIFRDDKALVMRAFSSPDEYAAGTFYEARVEDAEDEKAVELAQRTIVDRFTRGLPFNLLIGCIGVLNEHEFKAGEAK